MEIILFRHGKPLVSSDKKVLGTYFTNWLEEYENSGIQKTASPKNRYSKVICSDLRRSRDTAEAIGEEIQEEALFREAELPKLAFPKIKLPANIWVIVSRILWRIGFSCECESYKTFKKRIDEAMIWIEDQNEPLVIVGHGWMNRFLIKKLTEPWRVVESTGHGYLGCTKLRKVEQ